MGRAGSRAHILADDDELRAWGVQVRWVNRGGGCVLHMPGQLTAYLVLPLERFRLDVGAYLDAISRVLQGVLTEFDLGKAARCDPGGALLCGARVASLGVAIRRWISYYGFTLNVGPFLAPFELIEDIGPMGVPIAATSMEAIRQRPAPMSKVRESLLRHVEMVFGMERHVLFTSHPMIRREAVGAVLAQSAH